MQLLDQGHHPYISTGFGGKHFYSLVYIYIYLYLYIRQHGSAVYVGMVVVVCIP